MQLVLVLSNSVTSPVCQMINNTRLLMHEAEAISAMTHPRHFFCAMQLSRHTGSEMALHHTMVQHDEQGKSRAGTKLT